MKKKEYKELPEDIKFSTNPNDDIERFMETAIARLILSGAPLDELLGFRDVIEKKKDREEVTTFATNILLDFIKLNPEYADKLKQNDDAHTFLKNLGINL